MVGGLPSPACALVSNDSVLIFVPYDLRTLCAVKQNIGGQIPHTIENLFFPVYFNVFIHIFSIFDLNQSQSYDVAEPGSSQDRCIKPLYRQSLSFFSLTVKGGPECQTPFSVRPKSTSQIQNTWLALLFAYDLT